MKRTETHFQQIEIAVAQRRAEIYAENNVQGNERWKDLCEQASKEQDPKKLIELIREINSLLEEKKNLLERAEPPKRDWPSS
jgi:hypothetical protein